MGLTKFSPKSFRSFPLACNSLDHWLHFFIHFHFSWMLSCTPAPVFNFLNFLVDWVESARCEDELKADYLDLLDPSTLIRFKERRQTKAIYKEERSRWDYPGTVYIQS